MALVRFSAFVEGEKLVFVALRRVICLEGMPNAVILSVAANSQASKTPDTNPKERRDRKSLQPKHQ
jgi:hypothetical protein